MKTDRQTDRQQTTTVHLIYPPRLLGTFYQFCLFGHDPSASYEKEETCRNSGNSEKTLLALLRFPPAQEVKKIA